MSRLRITDNHDWIHFQKVGQDVSKADLKNLERIANVPISKLSLDDNPNLLLFPRDFSCCDDEISESEIISLKEENIKTGNIMGFVGVNETQLDICSRFDKQNTDDYFLHYMLQKVFSINIFDIKHSLSKEPVFDFLLYLFPHFLKKALAQGLFKKYKRISTTMPISKDLSISAGICTKTFLSAEPLPILPANTVTITR